MSDPSDIRQSSISSAPAKKTVTFSFNGQAFIKVLAVVLIALLAFWLGTIYGNHHHKDKLTSVSSSTRGGFGGFGGRSGGGFGTVSSVSSTSITITSRGGTSKTYAITSNTKITDGGQSATVSSIADGDRVIIAPSSSSSSDAGTIILNPSFGGFGGGQAPDGSGTSGSSTSGGSASGSATTQ